MTVRPFLAAALALTLLGCGYIQFETLDEQTKAAWSEVLNNPEAFQKFQAAQRELSGTLDLVGCRRQVR